MVLFLIFLFFITNFPTLCIERNQGVQELSRKFSDIITGLEKKAIPSKKNQYYLDQALANMQSFIDNLPNEYLDEHYDTNGIPITIGKMDDFAFVDSCKDISSIKNIKKNKGSVIRDLEKNV